MDTTPNESEAAKTGQNLVAITLPRRRLTVGRVILRILGVVITIVLALALVLVGVCFMIFKGPSPAARDLTVTTFLESGNMKFIPALFLSSEEISEIVNKTALGEMDTSVLDANLVDASQTGAQAAQLDPNGLEIVEVSGRNYFGKLMIVNDPSRVKVGTTYPFTEYGKNLDEIVTNSGGVAGVNGGLYDSLSLKGGYPWGVVISQGEVQYMDIDHDGLYIIGMDKNNLLQIIAIEGMSQAEVESLIAEKGIRDCVCFQEEASDTNNHFVPLVINGEPRELGGLGSGANPRTVIGQRADGAILLLVTDGRGAQGHLGATASDLINIMIQHGAVNAANLDGGSSSCMYYNGAYEMTSVTLYYANASWLMPTAFVIEAR